MQLQLKRTDSRFAGYDRFKYYIKIIPSYNESALEEFYRLRHWCWDAFGPSREMHKVFNIFTIGQSGYINAFEGDKNELWSWINDNHRARLYLKGNDEAALFKLKWS